MTDFIDFKNRLKHKNADILKIVKGELFSSSPNIDKNQRVKDLADDYNDFIKDDIEDKDIVLPNLKKLLDLLDSNSNNLSDDYKSSLIPHLKRAIKSFIPAEDLLGITADIADEEGMFNYCSSSALKRNSENLRRLMENMIDLPSNFEMGDEYNDEENLEDACVNIEYKLDVLKFTEEGLSSALNNIKKMRLKLDFKKSDIDCILNDSEYADEIRHENLEQQLMGYEKR